MVADGRMAFLEVVADGRRVTAEGRLDNCSPRLARLPGVGCRMRDLPPKSGCINYLQDGG